MGKLQTKDGIEIQSVWIHWDGFTECYYCRIALSKWFGVYSTKSSWKRDIGLIPSALFIEYVNLTAVMRTEIQTAMLDPNNQAYPGSQTSTQPPHLILPDLGLWNWAEDSNRDTDPIIDTRGEPANNDGRQDCFWCGAPTEARISIMSIMNVCTRCGK